MDHHQNIEKRVSFLNLSSLHREHQSEFLEAIESVIGESAFIGGKFTERFEKEFAAWINPSFSAVGCGNGTDALILAAKVLAENSPGEVCLPAMTFVATAEAAIFAGYRVKLVDVEPGTWLMDPEQLKRAITPTTRLCLPVHLYGQMADMESISSIAQTINCAVLEDAAQAHGARWNNHSVGYFSNAATFSFFPGKNLGAFGDGGAIVSKDFAFIERCSMMAKHGGLKKYEHLIKGQCSRLDGLQAAILSVKMKYIEPWTESRRQVATWYREYLSGLKGLSLPVEHPAARHVYHLFVVEVVDRTGLQQHLKNKGIETGVHYPKAIHQQPAFRDLGGNYPVAERIAAHGLSLPMCPTLQEADVKYVAESVRQFFR